MRASSLSNDKIIDLLNHYFVPVHLRNDRAESESSGDNAEKVRIYQAALKAGLSAGTVCAYLITPDGQPIATAPLNQPLATDPEQLAELMREVIGKLNVQRGEAIVRPTGQSRPKSVTDNALTLHLTARYLERVGDAIVPTDVTGVLGTKRAGNWANLPSENWIVLSPSEWSQWLPGRPVQPDLQWELDRNVTAKLLQHFFPPTENTDIQTNRIDDLAIRARVSAIEGDIVRVGLEGRLKMKHPFYHKDDNFFVTAGLIGSMDIDLVMRRIVSFRLVTDRAAYGAMDSDGHPFGVAVRSRD